jgi:ankyrin repeat protein
MLGDTALHIAAASGCFLVGNALLEQGASVNIINTVEYTALDYLIEHHYSCLQDQWKQDHQYHQEMQLYLNF